MFAVPLETMPTKHLEHYFGVGAGIIEGLKIFDGPFSAEAVAEISARNEAIREILAGRVADLSQ